MLKKSISFPKSIPLLEEIRFFSTFLSLREDMNLAVSSQSFIGPRLSTDEIGPDPYRGVSTQHSTPLPPSFRVHY